MFYGAQLEAILHIVKALGGPVAYTLFTVFLYLRLERRSDRLIDAERARTDAERSRAEALQLQLFQVSKSQIEAMLRTESTLNAYLEAKEKNLK